MRGYFGLVTFVTSSRWSPQKLHLIARKGPSASSPTHSADRAVVAAFATANRILPAMPLPADFYWTTRSASRSNDPLTTIACSGGLVALTQQIDHEGWEATLGRHRHGPGGQWRSSSSYEQGCAGAELWVAGMRGVYGRTWPRSLHTGRQHA